MLEDFTEEFRRRYKVECVSALHHNKRKTNYHIHLIFSERRLLAEPEVKIATRSVFYDETGKRVRTKKEITGEDGQIREGCTVIPKGGVYEQHLFTVKDERFKGEPFLEEVKRTTPLLSTGISTILSSIYRFLIPTVSICRPRRSERTIPKPQRSKPTMPQGGNGTGRRTWRSCPG